MPKPEPRASGKTAAQESAFQVSKDADRPLDTDIEQKRLFRTPGFSRMRIDWKTEDRAVLDRARVAAEKRVVKEFSDAFQVMNRLYDLVRTPSLDTNGQVRTDPITGFVIWAKDEYGGYTEDWDKLTHRERDDMLFVITSRLFAWEQRAQDAWGEAMLSKGMWEERHAIAFDAPMSGTMGDREAAGRKDAAEERYFAIFESWYSRRCEALVRSMTLLAQRLRDSLYSGR